MRAKMLSERLNQHPDLTVTVVASAVPETYAAIEQRGFDVSVCSREYMEGAARVRNQLGRVRDTSFISNRFFMVKEATPAEIVRGVHLGYDNYLVETDSPDVWADTIKRTVDGEISLRDESVWPHAGPAIDMTRLSIRDLSPLDTEIVSLLAEGLTNDQIAKILNFSSQTIRNHVTKIMDDVGVSNRTMLTLVYLRTRLAAEDDSTFF